MRNVIVPAAGAAFFAVAAVWLAAQPVGAATEEIDAGNNYFCEPSFTNGVCTTTITEGDTVTWTSAGIHTVTECDSAYTTCPPGGGFDSGVLESAETFSHTFDAAGSFAYYCGIHPFQMRGAINVVAAATDTPTPTAEATGSPSPTLSPATMPTSGGEPASGDLPLQALVLVFGGVLAGAGAVSLYAARRG